MEKLKSLKKDQILIGILVGVLLLVIALPQGEENGTGQADTEKVSESVSQPADKTGQMEQELQSILEQVQGVGKVRVMITIKSYGKKTVEKDSSSTAESSASGSGESSETKRTEETTVYARDSQGNETPFVTEETAPVVEGVLVAAQGGDNLTVAENIADAAEVLFGVEAHKIKVMKLN